MSLELKGSGLITVHLHDTSFHLILVTLSHNHTLELVVTNTSITSEIIIPSISPSDNYLQHLELTNSNTPFSASLWPLETFNLLALIGLSPSIFLWAHFPPYAACIPRHVSHLLTFDFQDFLSCVLLAHWNVIPNKVQTFHYFMPAWK